MLIIVVLQTILYKIAAKLQLFFETAKNNCKKNHFFRAATNNCTELKRFCHIIYAAAPSAASGWR